MGGWNGASEAGLGLFMDWEKWREAQREKPWEDSYNWSKYSPDKNNTSALSLIWANTVKFTMLQCDLSLYFNESGTLSSEVVLTLMYSLSKGLPTKAYGFSKSIVTQITTDFWVSHTMKISYHSGSGQSLPLLVTRAEMKWMEIKRE